MSIKSLVPIWRRFRRNRWGLAAGIFLFCLILAIIVVNLLMVANLLDWGKDNDCLFRRPAEHCNGKFFLLGTDNWGRDLLLGILRGGGVTLLTGFIVTVISLIFGTILGYLSGYYCGRRFICIRIGFINIIDIDIDDVIQGLVEITMSIPRLALLVALSFIIIRMRGKQEIHSFLGIIFVLSIVSWAPLARVIRGQVLALREEEFILAAKAIGIGSCRFLWYYILRNISSYLVVAATLLMPEIIILESVLSFLGYGIQGEWVSWGSLLTENRHPLIASQLFDYYWLFFPALFIFITVLAFNLLGDAVRDILEPRQ